MFFDGRSFFYFDRKIMKKIYTLSYAYPFLYSITKNNFYYHRIFVIFRYLDASMKFVPRCSTAHFNVSKAKCYLGFKRSRLKCLVASLHEGKIFGFFYLKHYLNTTLLGRFCFFYKRNPLTSQ